MRKQFVKSTSDSGSQLASTSKNSPAAKSKKSTDANITSLSKEEKATLDKCVAIITKGLGSYVEIGAAFKEIKEKQLHRAAKLPFYDYCKKVLGMSKAHVNRSIQASDCAKHIEKQAPNGAYAVPRNEGSARIIAGLPPEDRLKVTQLVKKTVGDAIPTAEDFKKAKCELFPPKAKPPADAKKVVLREAKTMTFGNLWSMVDEVKCLIENDKTKEEMLKAVNEAMEIVEYFNNQIPSVSSSLSETTDANNDGATLHNNNKETI